MNIIQLTDLDMRLLRVLNALLELNSVSRAAAVLGVTPSAVSHSLRALRTRLADPLFVRTGGALHPTPRALAIRPLLQRALADLQHVMQADAAFDAAQSQRQFSLAAPDLVLDRLTGMISELRETAPGVRFRWLGIDGRLTERLASGEIDLVLTSGYAERFLSLDRDTIRVKAFEDRFVCVMRPGHDALEDGALDLATYAELPHIFVSFSGQSRGAVDDALDAFDVKRRNVLTLSNTATALRVVASSDLVATMPTSLVRDSIAKGEVVAVEPPLKLPAVDAYLWWHARMQHDPGHMWWRSLVLQGLAI